MKRGKFKYLSFDKIPYLYESMADSLVVGNSEGMIDPDLKIAG
jgi:hypothetical protein